jgi:hypothetical protein
MEMRFESNNIGTGGVFYVSGSGGGSVTIWVSRFHGANGTRTFSAAGTRAGDGAVSWSGETGCYIAHAASVVGSSVLLSPPIAFRVADGTLSLYERVLIAIREYIMSLALPGVATDPDKHVIAKMGAKLQELLRTGQECVYYIPTAESFESADNVYASVSLPVNVIFMTKSGHSLRAGLSQILIAREDANLSFNASPLPDVPEVYDVDMKPGVVTDPNQWAAGYDVSVLQFIAMSEQVDGIL